MTSAVARQIKAIASDLRGEISFPTNIHVVIIDDQIMMAEPMHLICNSFGISSSLIITDGTRPLIIPSRKNESTVINLDHHFPHRTGRSFLKEIRNGGHRWPVGSTTAEDFRRALKYLRPWRYFPFKALLTVKPTREAVEAYLRFNLELVGDLHYHV